ncbi:MAG TPA: hypothetical protein VIF62_38205 [Labilithrix sp.]
MQTLWIATGGFQPIWLSMSAEVIGVVSGQVVGGVEPSSPPPSSVTPGGTDFPESFPASVVVVVLVLLLEQPADEAATKTPATAVKLASANNFFLSIWPRLLHRDCRRKLAE